MLMRLIILSAFCLLVPSSRAAVLVYEGFNYTLANQATMGGSRSPRPD